MSMEIRWGVCTLLHAMHNIQCVYIYTMCIYIYNIYIYDTLQYNTLHIYIYTHARHIYYGGVLKCYLHIPGFFWVRPSDLEAVVIQQLATIFHTAAPNALPESGLLGQLTTW